MGDKRKETMSGPSFKRRRISYAEQEDGERSPTPQERPNNDPFFGQKSAFPGLDDGGDGLLYGDPEDGLEYLRMVRYVSLYFDEPFALFTGNRSVLCTPARLVI
jgi:hypothetical protein